MRPVALLPTILLLSWGVCAFPAELGGDVAGLVAKMPGATIAEERQVAAELVRRGPSALAQVAGMLKPPGGGDDHQARAALKAVAYTATGRNRARVAHALVQAAQTAAHPRVKAFLVELLQVVGGRESVGPLGAFLREPEVCEPAVQALVAIGGRSAAVELVRALPNTTGPAKVSVLKALGDLQARGATRQILPYANDPDGGTRLAALYALARIGDLGAATTLTRAAGVASAYERSQATGHLLTFARRLAETGRKDECARICRTLIEQRARTREYPTVCSALAVLASALRRNALPDLIAALDSEERAVRQTALKLALDQARGAATARLVALLRTAPPEVRADVIQALAGRGDAAAAPAVLDALQDPDRSVRLAAVEGAARLRGDAVVQRLLAALVLAGTDEADAIRRALACQPSQSVLAAVTAALPKAAPKARGVLLRVLPQVGGPQALQAAAPYLDDPATAGDAAAAAMQVIVPEGNLSRALQGPQVLEMVRRIAVRATDGETRCLAYTYLAAPRAADDPNLARGKAVTTSVPTEGEHSPERAVDGDALNRDGSSWWGARTPAWIRVDLGKPETIATAQVFFYWDGRRYYQYTIDVSTDGESWTTVVDQSGNTAPATPRGVAHAFTPVTARYVRVHVLKNSANQAVHLVELKLYAPGKAPAAPPAPVPDAEGFVPIFNGRDLTGWAGSVDGYVVENGAIVCIPEKGGVLHTIEEYSDFHLKFEFKLVPGANNGIGIRFDGGNAAYGQGMEIQVLDDSAEIYKNLQPYQYHGSIYGVVPAKRGHQKPVGEWNEEEIIAKGRRITVILNGVTIVDADLDEASTPETMDHQPHPGLKSPKGFIGFLGHGTRVEFRNLRVKDLSAR